MIHLMLFIHTYIHELGTEASMQGANLTSRTNLGFIWRIVLYDRSTSWATAGRDEKNVATRIQLFQLFNGAGSWAMVTAEIRIDCHLGWMFSLRL